MNSLIKEFTILGYPGSLEEEIRKYTESENRETSFNIARIDDNIKYLTRRIQLAISEKSSASSPQYLEEYIHEMEIDLEKLQSEKREILNQKILPITESVVLKSVRDDLTRFVRNIKIESTDIQHKMLKRFVQFIVADLSTNGYKLQYIIKVPEDSEFGSKIILKKTLYFASDLQ